MMDGWLTESVRREGEQPTPPFMSWQVMATVSYGILENVNIILEVEVQIRMFYRDSWSFWIHDSYDLIDMLISVLVTSTITEKPGTTRQALWSI